jgi:tetrapyrrole methylase family protein/MazG family protein
MRDGFLEEAAEVLEALDTGDEAALLEELGDVLYHLVMQIQMAAESGAFTLSDVVGGIITKLKRRHPHVWGDWEVADSAEVLRNWEILKEGEKGEGHRPSVLDNIPVSLPALARSQKIQQRVKKVGFDWPDQAGVYAKVEEELGELRNAASPEAVAAELGDVLFAAVNLARWLGVDAESALREANLRFTTRFQRMEELAAEKGIELKGLELAALDELWSQVKAVEAPGSDEEE